VKKQTSCNGICAAGKRWNGGKMKQMIVLLSTVILGIAIAAMVLGFKDTTAGITDSTKAKMEQALGFEAPATE
jgi:uncharacterized membrane protein (DUF4010 family)